MPRVRCAGGNPLNPPVVSRTTPGIQGQPWSGFRPGNVVVVTPASTAIRNITIIDIVDNRWIARRIGDDGHRDVVLRPPVSAASPGRRTDTSPGTSPRTSPGTSPSAVLEQSPRTGPFADEPASDCVAPTPTVTRRELRACRTAARRRRRRWPRCRTVSRPPRPPRLPPLRPPLRRSRRPRPGISLPPLAPRTPAPNSTESDRNAPQDPLAPLDPSEEEIGPDTVPEIPDLPDGGGLIPDESPDADTVFDAPTDVFDG
ncbi:hypothetical protein O1M63_47600 [Streptomyces mirabilis]|nr:hypothetical protein [Streptomyces mirabilis]